jgi:hypothetical protein
MKIEATPVRGVAPREPHRTDPAAGPERRVLQG